MKIALIKSQISNPLLTFLTNVQIDHPQSRGVSHEIFVTPRGSLIPVHLPTPSVPVVPVELKRSDKIRMLTVESLLLQIENLEDLLKEKDNQVDMARARLTAMQTHHCSNEGALSSLEEAIGDKEKQMAQLREQRDRAEQEKQEERELHERELAEYKMKIHALESEVSPTTSRW